MLAYAQGNVLAFEQLYAKHKLIVYRFFIKQKLTLAVAEELTHDTWLKVINAREQYVVSAKFTTYLFTIARRIFIDFQQKKSTQCEITNKEDVLDELAQPPNTINENDETQQLNIAIKQQILLLPYDQREVFLLKQEAGFSIEEIAKITEQNKESVKSRWRYAIKKIREGLSAYV